jgi:L-ascorbate metabolism protein UlaG (beta-lactamase superfamily)
MKITYIHHSSFSVDLESTVLLFDYYKGTIPQFDKNKHIFVFVSHNHHDHFNDEIFKLSELYPQITYILSQDITSAKVSHKKNVIYTVANTTIHLPISSEHENMICETFKSTDQGVGYLVTANKKVIYHAGDLHWWAWEDDTKEEARFMEEAFKSEIDQLKDRRIDVAFLPLDGRLGPNYWLGFDYFIKKTDTTIAFPMHFWKDHSIIEKFKNSKEVISYKNKIMDITEDNQEFNL